jgi:hypothetical protein
MFVKSGNVRAGLRPGCSGHGRIVLATVKILACFRCIAMASFRKMRTLSISGNFLRFVNIEFRLREFGVSGA